MKRPIGGISLSEPKKQNYLHGAAILAAGVVIIKILGAIYKIPLGNILGDTGMSHFLVSYNIYGVFLTLATAGLPVALSRMISEANTMHRPAQVKRTFSVAWCTFFVLGLVCTLVMFFYPTELAVLFRDPGASQSIKALAPALLLVCLTSAYRGYCQGHENMKPTTVGQIFEVLFKVLTGLALAIWLKNIGKSLSIVSAGAIFGVTVGSLAALAYMFIYKRRNYTAVIETADAPDSSWQIFKNLLRIGIPITLGSSVLSLLNVVDSALCLGRLQDAAGFSAADATVLYGIYGKAQTLYNLPSAFITPLTISVVPAIAACRVTGRRREASAIAENSLRISTVIALPMGVGLSVLSYPIINVLYPNSNAAGPELLAWMGIASYFVCMALIMNAIMQASGNERYPIYSMLIGGAVKVALNWWLIGDPGLNILGAPIATLCSYAVMCIADYLFLCRVMADRPRLGSILIRPVLSCAAMGLCAWAVYGLAIRFLGGPEPGRLMLAVCMLAAIAVAVVVYLVLVVLTKAVTYEDMKLIPKGEKLAKLLRIRP